jgi:hypothetical protein
LDLPRQKQVDLFEEALRSRILPQQEWILWSGVGCVHQGSDVRCASKATDLRWARDVRFTLEADIPLRRAM